MTRLLARSAMPVPPRRPKPQDTSLKAPASLVSEAGANSKVIAALPAGASLRAVKVEILTVRPAVCEAVRDGAHTISQWVSQGGRKDTRDIQVPIRRGDRVHELGYYEEGTCSIWIKGATGLAECGMNGLSGGAPLCRYAGPEKPVTEVWAHVVTSNGQRGWIRNPKATGMSRHD